MTSPLTAASTYASLARITGGNDSAGAGGLLKSENKGPSFGALVENALNAVVESGRAADSKAMSLAAGKADLIDVVTAVSETEVAVETLVSVRDKVIQAYEEIFRMPI
jgi:flagellar hook-basal body complex protein FliE